MKKGPMPLLLRANGKGPLSNFKQCKIMKSKQFLVLFSILLIANAVAYFASCRQDEAASLTPKPTGDMPATYRACTDDTGCSYVITANNANFTVVLCGDIPIAGTACSVGCGTNANDRSLTVPLTMGTPYSFCVDDAGSVCVFNPGMADITVDVGVAGLTPITVPIPAGQRSCFSSDDNCTVTNNHCY